MKIGEKIKTNRQQKEWTQEQLAERLHVSRSAVSGWEVGRNYPDLETVVQISDLFEISLDELLREDVQMVKEVTKKTRMNKYLKLIIAFLLVMIIGYVGFNLKLRSDENHYRENLSQLGWQQDPADQSAGNGYRLEDAGIEYSTYVLPAGTIGFPLREQELKLTAKKDGLTVYIGNENMVVFTDEIKTETGYGGSYQVDDQVNLLEKDLKADKKAKVEEFLVKHQKDYQELIKAAHEKRGEIIK